MYRKLCPTLVRIPSIIAPCSPKASFRIGSFVSYERPIYPSVPQEVPQVSKIPILRINYCK